MHVCVCVCLDTTFGDLVQLYQKEFQISCKQLANLQSKKLNN